MKNKSVVKRKILTVVIGLLLLISYILGNIEMGKLGSKMDYVNLLSQGIKSNGNSGNHGCIWKNRFAVF